MEQFATFLVENPLYLVLAVIASIAILLLLLKKVLKLFVVLAAVGVLYVAYLYWSGENVPEAVRSMQQALDAFLARFVDYVKHLGHFG